MVNSPAVETVLAWHAALNAGDVDHLLLLSTEDVEVGGPRGSGHGAELVREWFARAGIRLEPLRWFSHESAVVVEQVAAWRADTGGFSEPRMLASVFRVRDDRVASVLRFDELSAALESAGLGQDNPSPPSR